MRVFFGGPLFGKEERAAVEAVLKKRTLTSAGRVMEFEERFVDLAGGGMAVAMSSCMAALHVACRMLVDPGMEIIVPALTHPATAHAVELVGAKPVFVDVDAETGNMTAAAIKAAIGPKTRAIIVVHYLGRLCDMAAIMALARKHDLAVIEDCALALGTTAGDVHAGLFGDVGCFSFYPVKHITTGEGGMLLTKHPQLAARAKRIRSFGTDPETKQVVEVGTNYRMTEIAAALGICQLRRLPEWLDKRRRNYARLYGRLDGFRKIDSRGGAHYALTAFPEAPRRKVQIAMSRVWIETSVYYDPIVPLHPFYRDKYGYTPEQFPVAHEIATKSIALGCGPHIDGDQIAFMTEVFRKEAACVSC